MKTLGRPTVVTDEVLAKLEQAFSIGCTDAEASFYAGIGEASLYRYCEEHPEFRERKEGLKDRPIVAARRTVVEAVTHDADKAFEYLRRKRKKEFSERTETDITSNDQPITGEPSVEILEIAAGVQALLKKKENWS